MAYYSGFVTAVPVARRQEFVEHAAQAWPMFQKHGATRLIETWGVDVPDGTKTDFRRAVQAEDDEAVLFSWIEWPDKATADAARTGMQDDPGMADMGEMPFDGSRMIWGGFEPVFDSRGGA